MMYEWDEAKRAKNIIKHGFDFIQAPNLFSSDHIRGQAHDGKDGEKRWLITGLIQGRYATLIFTMRGKTIRLISLRSAKNVEKRQHQKVFD